MSGRRNFWDRLWFLVVSMICLLVGLSLAYGLWVARPMSPGILLPEKMAVAIDWIRCASLPTTAFIIGTGMWCFYQALKEE